MADIILLGQTYYDVPDVNLPQVGGGTAVFYEVSGSQTLTQNDTYDVTTLASVTVNVSGGGGNEWTSGIYQSGSYIKISPLPGAGGITFSNGFIIMSST